MARAYSAFQQQDFAGEQSAGDLDALRGEIVALLDQVENQVARARRDQEPGYQRVSERMRNLREQVGDEAPEQRHRDALLSVRRAIDRFSERDEDVAPNPRDTLQSAVRQIRERHGGAAPLAQRGAEMPRFDELAHAVGGISGRLERLEAELKTSARSQTGNVKEIAEQVAQLSHVVELLAGAVGETGQVKRLESQIAGLAQLVAQGPQIDFSGLTRRLDELSGTVTGLVDRQRDEGLSQRLDDVTVTMGRLADLQVQFANRVDSSTDAIRGIQSRLDDVSRPDSGMQDGMAAIAAGIRTIEGRLDTAASPAENLAAGMAGIETAIRGIYDRIDAIERSTAMPPAELDRLTREMATLTASLRDPRQLDGIVPLVEEISARIGAIESSSRDVGELKLDMEALRHTVEQAVEPRFSAIESQLADLNERVAEPRDVNIGQLEAQVRQLVARMDQTGEQLSGLARLYAQPAEREPAPDFEALADMVAARASEAMAVHAPAPTAASGLDAADIDEIERRVSRLMDAAAREKPAEELSGIESSIREVSERLARLENALTARAREAAELAAMPPAPLPEPAIITVPATATPSPIVESRIDAAQEAPALRGDAMPVDPAVEAPLRDRPFGDDGSALLAALDVKNGTRKRHPGLSRATGIEPGEATPPTFDPATAERPPRPVSAFDSAPEVFARSEPPAPLEPVADQPSDTPPSANTFIAAARRAAQRQTQASNPGAAGSGSLIARAFASFQAGKTSPTLAAVEETAASEPVDEKPVRRKLFKDKAPKPKSGKKGRLLAGDKDAPTEWKPEDEVPAAEVVTLADAAPSLAADDTRADAGKDAARESFLSRHRRPILLAASVVAIAFLTLNLINQRMGSGAGTERAQSAADTSSLPAATSRLSGEPVAAQAAAISAPRLAPIVDSLATASIDPAASAGFTPAEAQTMPSAFAPSPALSAAETAIDAALPPVDVQRLVAPAEMASPVQVEMPPEGLGPEALRLAASQGDARAQFEVAAIYTEGRAVSEDLAAAAIWYERAAAQGFAPAQYRLGNLYENGRGVTRDLQQARLWYQRAAEAGNRMAMHNLAALYAGGELGKQDFEAAAQWFEQAATRGMRDSQFNLGMLHARGLGVTQDFEVSFKWFSLAAANGDADAAKARDDMARSLDAEAMARIRDEIAGFEATRIDLAANFAPIGTWSDNFDPGEVIENQDVVRSVQMALAGLGFDVGMPDGLMGPKTGEAIKSFERATGMSERGRINPRLLAVLGSQPV